ncbi:hypothetical protein YC2023_104920 [Brassica napus]
MAREIEIVLWIEIAPRGYAFFHTKKMHILEKHLQPERWNKLVRGGKAPHYVKVDWDKWVDEDDEGSAGAGDMDMGGMGGMDFSVCFQLVNLNFGGMGGMEGLGGMGGMGGMEEFEDSDDEEYPSSFPNGI